ncbi:MAG: ABC transporter ATP-binding protein, partial [Miltoncostaeaceae bacterium]
RLRDLRAGGTSVVITTHYMDEAERLCDRIAVIDHGQVVRVGAPAALVGEEGGAEGPELRTEPGGAAARAAAISPSHLVEGEILMAFGNSAREMRGRADGAGTPFEMVAERRATLEDLFIVLTGHSLREDSSD